MNKTNINKILNPSIVVLAIITIIILFLIRNDKKYFGTGGLFPIVLFLLVLSLINRIILLVNKEDEINKDEKIVLGLVNIILIIFFVKPKSKPKSKPKNSWLSIINKL